MAARPGAMGGLVSTNRIVYYSQIRISFLLFSTILIKFVKRNQHGGIDYFDEFLSNSSRIRQSKISLADVTVLTNFRHFL